MYTQEIMSKSAVEKTSLDRNLIRLEEENIELRQQLHGVQTQLSLAEQEHAQRYRQNSIVFKTIKHVDWLD